MSGQRKGQTEKPLSLGDGRKGLWPSWRRGLGQGQRKALGLGLMLLAALSLQGLLGISSGSILSWWSLTLRQLFGWSAYLMTLGLGLAGLWLLWQTFRDRFPLDAGALIGLEVLLMVVLTASHAPFVLYSGSDEALLAAQQGSGGGYVGWALAVLLVEAVGLTVGVLVLIAMLALALYLVLPLSWTRLLAWGHYQYRRLFAAISRWRLSRQGIPVAPEPQEEPWWEQEPALSFAQAPQKVSQKARTPRRRKRRPRDGGLPPLDLLDPASPQSYADTDVRFKMHIIEETLDSFGVPVKVVEVNQGPTVTQFGLDPGYIERRLSGGEVQRQRVRVARIVSLADDLALALAASPIRIEAPVPGRSVVGLEVPNEVVSLVSLRKVMESRDFQHIDSRLAIALGEDVSGHPVAVDLAQMPHLLIAGATGSGKSVCVNALICCLLFNNTSADLQMLLIDPKMVELTAYNRIPHLLAPVVVEVEQVVGALAWVTRKMDERYRLFHRVGARHLDDYNGRISRRDDEERLPNLVVFIDELADLMMVAPEEIERHICRVAQMGRATGIHLVIATQRPSVDVVTGLIKANFPARISFAVTSQIDSRVILDQAGAESLLGRGDMLFMSPQQSSPVRLQGCFVSDTEIARLTQFWQDQQWADKQAPLFPPWTEAQAEHELDGKFKEAIALIEGRKQISTSFIQRRLRIGFPRAARIIDQLEEHGLIGPDEGGGRGRQVLIGQSIDLDEIEERLPGVAPK